MNRRLCSYCACVVDWCNFSVSLYHYTFLVWLYCERFTPHFTTGVWLSRVTHVSLVWVMSASMVGGEKHNTIMTLNNSWFVRCVNWQFSVHLCRPCNSASVVTLRALRTGSVAFEAILWQNLNQLYDKWRNLKWLFTVVTWSPNP